ncbi:IpaD/SipD/SspD family type III secretion system needle tip protein [Pseudomonas typographi]|uniref:IpaD/SipD/SspD family type III secretion system needle tip protein n=1 Tax=Pseudomonas typographi TaxID=2715964 RepID=UPI001683C7C5|nr:IpaD/SipD/SspD family type III secretion system needle tip protein [Pseudomonas typographi]MBD1552395.1 IpaD/SipD/SspD family type III secretion system needle tip protein [Pseudomonas typographi]
MPDISLSRPVAVRNVTPEPVEKLAEAAIPHASVEASAQGAPQSPLERQLGRILDNAKRITLAPLPEPPAGFTKEGVENNGGSAAGEYSRAQERIKTQTERNKRYIADTRAGLAENRPKFEQRSHGLRSFADTVLASLSTEARQQLGRGAAASAGLPSGLEDRLLNVNWAPDPDDFFGSLRDLIDLIGAEYLEIYENLVQKYTDFYEEINAELISKLKDWVVSEPNGRIILKVGKPDDPGVYGILEAVEKLITKYGTPPESVLYESNSREDAEKWLKAMGLPADCLVDAGGGKFYVTFDLSPLKAIKALTGNLEEGNHNGNIYLTAAEFQAYQTGFYSHDSAIKNYLQIATNKYSNANAYYDNFVKILSQQLSQFAEMLKGYLN